MTTGLTGGMIDNVPQNMLHFTTHITFGLLQVVARNRTITLAAI